MTGALAVRRTARIVLIDAADRVLLLYYSGRRQGPAWITPGGGVEGNETHEEAALRELWEEVGLKEATLGPCVWNGSHPSISLDSLPQETQARYFLCRVDDYEPGEHIDSDPDEREVVTDRRWWSLAEIEMSSDMFLPSSFVTLLRRLIAGDLPSQPLTVDW